MKKIAQEITVKDPLLADQIDIGFDDDNSILLHFKGSIANETDKETYVVFPLEQLKDFIFAMFSLGVEIQKESGKDIGFGYNMEDK